jgi:stearoyl-CoA desaturase (delta-9 desaturase)
MIFESELRSGAADISDLRRDSLIQWQHRCYFYLAPIFGIALPMSIPGILWNDWVGGFYFSGVLRLTIAHHVSLPVSAYVQRV